MFECHAAPMTSSPVRSGLVFTRQVVGRVVIGPVVLDERRDGGDVAGVHGGHAGRAAHRGGLVVQVQHSGGGHEGSGLEMASQRGHLIENEAFLL